MSKNEGIPWELLKIEVPEGVPKETGFFEITGTATRERVSSRVYAWFLDREKNPVLAPLFCNELLRVAQEKLDDASVAERLALGKYECELEVTTSSQKRIDILLRDTEARLAIIIENKIHADLINDLLDYWNHVSYPETQKIGILLTLHPTEVPEDFKSIFINVTHSEWIMAVESAGVPTGIPLHTYGMMTDFFNAIRNQSANSTMNDQARFFFDNPRLVIRARECLNEAISYIKGELREVAELFEFTSSFKYYGYCYLKDKKCSSDAVIAVHFEQLVKSKDPILYVMLELQSIGVKHIEELDKALEKTAQSSALIRSTKTQVASEYGEYIHLRTREFPMNTDKTSQLRNILFETIRDEFRPMLRIIHKTLDELTQTT